MFAKLNRLSLIAALSIVAGTSAAAHAGPTAAEINVLESGNPHSVSFPVRDIGSRPVTKDELDSLEIGNPHSVNYAKRPALAATNEEIRSLETGNPDAVRE